MPRLLCCGPAFAPEFNALAADRLGDVLQLQRQERNEAVTAYQEAWKLLDPQLDYRALVGFKLNALGVAIRNTARRIRRRQLSESQALQPQGSRFWMTAQRTVLAAALAPAFGGCARLWLQKVTEACRFGPDISPELASAPSLAQLSIPAVERCQHRRPSAVVPKLGGGMLQMARW